MRKARSPTKCRNLASLLRRRFNVSVGHEDMIMEPETKRNRLATLALVLSIVALLSQPILTPLLLAVVAVSKAHRLVEVLITVVFVLPPVIATTAVILAHTARARIKRDPTLSGKSVSTAGMIIGYATLAYTVSAWIVAYGGSYLLKDMD